MNGHLINHLMLSVYTYETSPSAWIDGLFSIGSQHQSLCTQADYCLTEIQRNTINHNEFNQSHHKVYTPAPSCGDCGTYTF